MDQKTRMALLAALAGSAQNASSLVQLEDHVPAEQLDPIIANELSNMQALLSILTGGTPTPPGGGGGGPAPARPAPGRPR